MQAQGSTPGVLARAASISSTRLAGSSHPAATVHTHTATSAASAQHTQRTRRAQHAEPCPLVLRTGRARRQAAGSTSPRRRATLSCAWLAASSPASAAPPAASVSAPPAAQHRPPRTARRAGASAGSGIATAGAAAASLRTAAWLQLRLLSACGRAPQRITPSLHNDTCITLCRATLRCLPATVHPDLLRDRAHRVPGSPG
jgi:hypothetical protein